jgi:hypothetical protein
MKVIEREAKPKDLIDRQVARALRNQRRGRPPKYRTLKTRSREREYEQRRAVRHARLMSKHCTNCGEGGLTGGFRMCPNCRLKWRHYNTRCRLRKVFPLTPYSLGKIDLQGAYLDF